MTWLQLGVDAPAHIATDLADGLHALGALALTQSDASDIQESAQAISDHAIIEPPLGTTPLWSTTRLRAIFALDVDLGKVRQLIVREFSANKLETPECSVDFVEEQDWQHSWKQFAVSRLFAGRLMLAPRDQEVQVEKHQVLLQLDPGLAFGTGGHATTALCLEWLASQELRQADILDFGCGSGILSIAAALLGAQQVVALDHDPQALLATRENAAYNGLAEDRVCVVDSSKDYSPRQFTVVVANILTNTLVEYAQKLKNSLNEGGTLVLSGILENQVHTVLAAYEEFEFAIHSDSPWVCLVGRLRV